MKPRVTWILFLVIFIFSSCMSRWAFISETDYTKREEQIVKFMRNFLRNTTGF